MWLLQLFPLCFEALQWSSYVKGEIVTFPQFSNLDQEASKQLSYDFILFLPLEAPFNDQSRIDPSFLNLFGTRSHTALPFWSIEWSSKWPQS